MGQLKIEDRLASMFFFQNLSHAQQSAPLIAYYKTECIDKEQDGNLKERLLYLSMELPPLLAFNNLQQMVQFYDDITKKSALNMLCCGSLNHSVSANMNQITFTPKDYYLFYASTKHYEGGKESINNAIKHDISQTQFGSSMQETLINGLKTFNSTVNQQNRSSISIELVAPILSVMKKH